MKLELEACIEKPSEAAIAAAHGMDRAELCQALVVGGLTPTSANLKACAAHLPIHAMLRPRGGGFTYTADELDWMLAEMEALAEAGATGVVWGCLDQAGEIDLNANRILMDRATSLSLFPTFHRAFDMVSDHLKALNQLMELGFKRVLSSGGSPTALEGLEKITQMVNLSNGRIEIMAGGGVNASNAQNLSKAGVNALHFSIQKSIKTKSPLAIGNDTIPDPDKIESIKLAIG